MPDITTPHDLHQLVGSFYDRVRQDALLGPVFDSRIAPEAWPAHLETITGFWTAALLGQDGGYRGNPGARHIRLPIEAAHFERWLLLFGQSVDDMFVGEKAEEIKLRAARLGELFQFKIDSARRNGLVALL